MDTQPQPCPSPNGAYSPVTHPRQQNSRRGFLSQMPGVGQETLWSRELPVTGGVQAKAGWPMGKEAVGKSLSQEGG